MSFRHLSRSGYRNHASSRPVLLGAAVDDAHKSALLYNSKQEGRLQHAVLAQNLLQRVRVEAVVVGHHLNDARQVGHEVALVAVGQQGGHGGGVKLNVVVVDLDKVRRRVGVDEGDEGVFNGGGNLALFLLVNLFFFLDLLFGVEAYLIVVYKHHHRRVAADLFNGVEVAHGVDLVEPPVDAHTRARLSRAHRAVRRALELPPPALSPLAQEAVLILVAARIVVRLALAARPRAARNLHAVARRGRHAGEAEDAAARAACAVDPLRPAGRLVAARVGNDALDAGEGAAVKGRGGELELRGAVGGDGAHGGVDLGVAVGLLLAEVGRVSVGAVAVAVFGVGGGSGRVVGYQLVELFLGGGRSHVVLRVAVRELSREVLRKPGKGRLYSHVPGPVETGKGAKGGVCCGRAEASV